MADFGGLVGASMKSRLLGRKIWVLSAVGALFSLGPNGCKSSDSDDSGVEGAGTECSSDKDCREFDLLCDTAVRACVECLTSSHCSDLEICTNGECVEITPCESSRDCPDDQVCSEALYRCVDCVQDADCADGKVCAGEVCRAACASDKDCREFDLLCATAAGYCVECTSDTHCSDGQRCSAAGTCVGATSAPPGTGGRPSSAQGGTSPTGTGGAPVDAGAPGTNGGQGAGGTPPGETGGTENGGSENGGKTATGGKAATGGANSAGGDGTGGATGGRASSTGGTSDGGSGGAGSEEPFPPIEAACARLSSPTCLGCCRSVGVFALDRQNDSATELLVSSFEATDIAVAATFNFTDFEQVGAIYFKLDTAIAITDWNLSASISGGSVEVALSRDGGAAGCVYDAVGSIGTNWTQTACWPEIPTLGPWDQIEVRVRSYDPGPGSLVLNYFEIE
jgi:Cys-rich repeat protein